MFQYLRAGFMLVCESTTEPIIVPMKIESGACTFI